MTSPFPGMDPYLEQHWGDVHHGLITYARDQLQSRLPADLRARMQERIVVEPSEEAERSLYPDDHVAERGARGGATALTDVQVGTAQPLVIHLADEQATEGYIEIVEADSGQRVVTVIEVLSPSNKLAGDGQVLYRQKQRELKAGGVRLVEIDLLRSGKRVLAVPSRKIPKAYRTTYQVCVRRGWRPFEVEIYRVPLAELLPAIKVPLREGDHDVKLELQPLIEQVYRNGRYESTDYRADPLPPLAADDAAWADELLKRRGLR